MPRGKPLGINRPSYEELQKKYRKEEEEWAKLNGPITVRYIEKKDDA